MKAGVLRLHAESWIELEDIQEESLDLVDKTHVFQEPLFNLSEEH